MSPWPLDAAMLGLYWRAHIRHKRGPSRDPCWVHAIIVLGHRMGSCLYPFMLPRKPSLANDTIQTTKNVAVPICYEGQCNPNGKIMTKPYVVWVNAGQTSWTGGLPCYTRTAVSQAVCKFPYIASNTLMTPQCEAIRVF